MRNLCTLLAASVLTLGVSAIGSTAQAQPEPADVQVRVSHAGLDLGSEAGADLFLDHLSQAATQVCGGWDERASVQPKARLRFRSCHAEALAGAVAQVDSPVVQRRFAASQAVKAPRLAAN